MSSEPWVVPLVHQPGGGLASEPGEAPRAALTEYHVLFWCRLNVTSLAEWPVPCPESDLQHETLHSLLYDPDQILSQINISSLFPSDQILS